MSRLLILALLLPGCSAGVRPTVASDGTTASQWQPLEIGWRWTYEVDGGGTLQRVVVGRESVGRFDCRVIEQTGGNARLRWWLRSERDGLKLYRTSDGTSGQVMDDPAVWFRYPAVRGSHWEYETAHGPVELVCNAVYEDDERIRVPAGEFTCARVRTFGFCERTQVYEKVEWYAKGIGLVRQWAKWYDGTTATMSLREIAR